MEKESSRTVSIFKKKKSIGEAKYKRKMDESWRAIECTSRWWELRATHHGQNHHDACCASRDMLKRTARIATKMTGTWNGADSLLTVRCRQMRARDTN